MMHFIELFFIAIGLSMDTLAVCIPAGIVTNKMLQPHKMKLKLILLMALMQSFMTFAGWLMGNSFHSIIQDFDHWVAAILLFVIAGGMIYEGLKKETDGEKKINFHSNKTLFILAFATSIDALAVGISFALLDMNILFPVVIIGIVTFLFAYLGVQIGSKIKDFKRFKIEVLGGVILIMVAIKILIEHTVCTM
ncbi:MAG TPA: manganese efflux pump MntP family protein [Bacteroidales bacterium]|nr:manganese efflux pump MntP family protein [Bacteroidales bacterium]HOH21704.1 manganese efflux pump MntP family protein [Bacteroidales bacterium]HPB58105.1 manganese efflux pump MntP family protein [Bacteroidales bacterium]HPZ02843.1 manganese efflux pump MntP family protein [Bacteroidales bacterium]HQB74275.1 manganese efflux pump MntP family protein [Bacteroidales bacterium]